MSKIRDKVWFDENANGCQDDNEVGKDGILVELLKNGEVVQSTISGVDPLSSQSGVYEFYVCPGVYQLRFGSHELVAKLACD